jgi:hypothetical protein
MRDEQLEAQAPDQPPSAAVPLTRMDRILAYVPRALSSHLHILFLGGLGVYLVALPLFGLHVSSQAELIGGNYTNVTSDLGACIAAGLTVHLVRRDRRRGEQLRELIGDLERRNRLLEERLAETLAAAKRAEEHARRAAKG